MTLQNPSVSSTNEIKRVETYIMKKIKSNTIK